MQDEYFMEIALGEAQKSLETGNYPVGAVLTINNKIIDKAHNNLGSNANWISHAEIELLSANSQYLREVSEKNRVKRTFYTTLEPCLMCMGAIVMHRIDKVVVACPDPHGGAASFNPSLINDWYVQAWPKIKMGVLKEESYKLLIAYMKEHKWHYMLNLFKQIH